MKILYIHGLDSSPNPERMGWLTDKGHAVSALHLDYRNQPDSYDILKGKVQSDQIEYIVGSSLGGRLGFWLSEEFGLSCLLFNPALALEIPGLTNPSLSHFGCNKRYVVLGAQDDVVNPQETWEWLRKMEREGLTQRIGMFQHLGHQIDRDIYEESCRWAGL